MQVASVETADQARNIVQAVKYAPMGSRGLGLTAAHSDFRSYKSSEYLSFMNQQTIVITQIETSQGLANCQEIAAVDGIEVLAVGANDMSFSIGIQRQYDHPLMHDAMQKVIAACKKHGKFGKAHPHSTAQIGEFAAMGYTLMMGSSDVAIMRQGVKSGMDNLRSHLNDAVTR